MKKDGVIVAWVLLAFSYLSGMLDKPIYSVSTYEVIGYFGLAAIAVSHFFRGE